MKSHRLSILVATLLAAGRVIAATTIDLVNRYAYGANIGWIDSYADGANGAVIGEYVCSGYLYGADVGWINLGSGTPTNGIYYLNLSANDVGVNNDGLGNLRGYAWGANIGWVNFESTGAPKVDLVTGRLSGYVYSANCGWIGLSNAMAQLQTDRIAPGTRDTNGLPIAWELLNFGHTGVDPNADPDGDGLSNWQEYLAGTNPNDASSRLAITGFVAGAQGSSNVVTWQSVLTRSYHLQARLDLNPGRGWFDSGLGLVTPDGASTQRTITETNSPTRSYRVQAVRPLGP